MEKTLGVYSKKVTQLFLKGLIAVLPITVTFYILLWLASVAESTAGNLVRLVLPESWYVPGTGLLLGIATIITIGFLLNTYVFRKVKHISESAMQKIPVVQTIYKNTKDIAEFVSGSKNDELEEAVLVSISDSCKLMGFITRENVELDNETDDEETCAVYVPMSYQIGGFTLILPKSKVESTNLSKKEAMKFILTAGVSDNDNNQVVSM